MKIVLDTNVLVSALLNPDGSPAQVLNLLLENRLVLLYDNRIVDEYRRVLGRKKFSFTSAMIEPLLDFLIHVGRSVIALPQTVQFVDDGDRKFFEVAISGQADYLVTGNLRHYPAIPLVVSPAAFLEKFLSF